MGWGAWSWRTSWPRLSSVSGDDRPCELQAAQRQVALKGRNQHKRAKVAGAECDDAVQAREAAAWRKILQTSQQQQELRLYQPVADDGGWDTILLRQLSDDPVRQW